MLPPSIDNVGGSFHAVPYTLRLGSVDTDQSSNVGGSMSKLRKRIHDLLWLIFRDTSGWIDA